MQSLVRINLGPYFGRLHNDLLEYILRKLPIKNRLLARRICKTINQLNPSFDFNERYRNTSAIDFTFILGRIENFNKKNQNFYVKFEGSPLLPLVLKVNCSHNYIMWQSPPQDILTAIKQFNKYIFCYSIFRGRERDTLLENDAKEQAGKWAQKFNLPNRDWIENPTSVEVFEAAWKQSKEHLHRTYLAIAQGEKGDALLREMVPHCPLASLALGVAEKDKGQAVAFFKEAAGKELPEAQFELAQRYEKGEGVKKDLKEAARLYRLAADQNHLDAMTCLGNLYESGKGVTKNEQEAIRLYQLAADKNHPAALMHLGLFHLKGTQRNTTIALHLLWLAARQDYPQAQLALGQQYEEGVGVEKNQREALLWYCKACDLKYPHAYTILGNCFLEGRGVEKNRCQALSLYISAGNDPAALNKQGYLNFNYDNEAAFIDFKRAAEQGSAEGHGNLAYMYLNGIGVKKNLDKALHHYRIAAENDYPIAMLSLGVLLPPGEEADRYFEEGRKAMDLRDRRTLEADPAEVVKKILARLKSS